MSRFFEYENPFDLIAELIAHLRGLSLADFANKNYRAAMDIDQALEQAVDGLFRENAALSDRDILSQGIRAEGISVVRKWEHYQKFYYVLELLVRLDRMLPWEKILNSTYVDKKLNRRFKALNENADEVGIQIVPHVPGLNEVKGQGEKQWLVDWLPGINNELKNVYYIEREQLKGHQVQHIVAKRLQREGKRVLRVAASPLLRAEVLDTHEYQKEECAGTRKYFSVAGLKKTEDIRKRVKAAILRACEEDADILVFPEMLGFEEFAQDDGFLADIQKEADQRNLPLPFLVFAPTWWHDRKNELSVFDDSGECLFVQQKQYSFLYKEYGKNCCEDLSESGHVIHVLHIPEMGRIMCPICIDYLQLEYRAILVQALRATMLICPSYTRSTTLFDCSATAEAQNGCYMVWLNTCCATWKEAKPPEMVGFVSGPQKGDFCRLNPECEGKCGANEQACLFTADISWEGRRPEIAAPKHLFGEGGAEKHYADKRTVSEE